MTTCQTADGAGAARVAARRIRLTRYGRRRPALAAAVVVLTSLTGNATTDTTDC